MLIAGVDSGGTSTKCVLLNEKGVELAASEAGPGNYQIVGMDAAVNEIRKAVSSCLGKVQSNSLDILGIGTAGAGRKEDRIKYKSALSMLGFIEKNYITNDAHVAVLGATNGNPGLVLIAGTGSIAYGLTENKETIRSGGWGPILGDEGSGYWIGMEAVRTMIKIIENRMTDFNEWKLTDKILNHLKISNPDKLVPFIYQENLPRAEIASIAPLILNSWEDGDRIAEWIINKAAVELSLLANSVINNLETNLDYIYVTGGLFENSAFRDLVNDKINETHNIIIKKPILPAVYGAAIFAAQKAGLNIEVIYK